MVILFFFQVYYQDVLTFDPLFRFERAQINNQLKNGK